MKIKVTQKDIEEGYRGSCHDCPVALAFKREVKTAFEIGHAFDRSGRSVSVQIGLSVGAERILHREVHEWDTYTLPKRAQTFIKRFDNGKSVEPFTFEIKKDLK
jgi:hypothetical protein